MATLKVRLAARDAFLAKLSEAAKHREERWDFEPGPYGEEPAWVGWEAGQMLALVNELRAEDGLEPATLEQVRRIEQSACGHSDYADKYALRCAFLALGERADPMADDREQIVWQLRANLIHALLLREQIKGDLLPVLRWTIQSAGCVLYGEPGSSCDTDAAKASAVRAWAGRLGLDVRETPVGDGESRITAHGKYERVTVSVSAKLYGDEEDGSDD